MVESRRDRVLRRAMLAGALAAGLTAGGGVAWAFWGATASVAPPTLTAGNIDLTVTPAGGVPTGWGGSGGYFVLDALQVSGGYFPGTTQSTAITLGNEGDVPIQVNMNLALPNAYGLGEVAFNLGSTVTATGGCTAATVDYPPVIQPGQELSVCISIALSTSAPDDAQGQTVDVTLSLSAQNLNRGG